MENQPTVLMIFTRKDGDDLNGQAVSFREGR